MMNGPRILLTNDDGIDAPGLQLLESIVGSFSDDIWVIAPYREKSGTSHAISMHQPIRMLQQGEKRYAIFGTPADCVLMAYYQLMRDRPPEVVLSGINNGANLGDDIIYSGTIAGAVEGTLLGVRSIAMSQVKAFGAPTIWATAEHYTPIVLKQLLALEHWPAGSLINVNFPDCEPADVAGIQITTQGRRPPGSFTVDPRIDTREVPYYWVKIRYKDGASSPGTDLDTVRSRGVAITPLRIDASDCQWLPILVDEFGQENSEIDQRGSEGG